MTVTVSAILELLAEGATLAITVWLTWKQGRGE